MDIRQIITQFQNRDTTSMSKEQLEAFRHEIENAELEYMEALRPLRALEQSARERIWELDRIERENENERIQQTMAERGFTTGSIFYIDRHDGLYVVHAVDRLYINFRRMKTDDLYGKAKMMEIRRLDSRLTPLRTQGPFSVGETVMRDGQEYKVEGYLGLRMVISRSISNRTVYTIVQKKDEKTYRSIIL